MDVLFLLSLALLFGHLGGKVTGRVKLPGVVGYILIGLILGPSCMNLFSLKIVEHMGIVGDIALALVAFMIGSEMQAEVLKRQGAGLAAIIFLESFAAFFLVTFLIYFLTHKWYIALLFGAMAPASAPAGTVAVLQECKAKGPLTSTLLSVVGLDDGLAIIIYGFAAALAKNLLSHEYAVGVKDFLMGPALEILKSLSIGALVGVMLSYIFKKIRSSNDFLVLTLGAILLCSGLSNIWHLSLILTNLTLGLVLTNLYLHGARKASDVIQNITAPIFVVFFVLAGAHLQIRLLPAMGFVGIVYIIGRSVGLLGGAYVGATIGKAEKNVRNYLGLGILSQAGVAIGLALIVVKDFSPLGPEGEYVATLVINTIAATTIIFEVIGPVTTKIAIEKAGEVGKLNQTD
jgi:Kef-type K+ transport system membrane component KefB